MFLIRVPFNSRIKHNIAKQVPRYLIRVPRDSCIKHNLNFNKHLLDTCSMLFAYQSHYCKAGTYLLDTGSTWFVYQAQLIFNIIIFLIRVPCNSRINHSIAKQVLTWYGFHVIRVWSAILKSNKYVVDTCSMIFAYQSQYYKAGTWYGFHLIDSCIKHNWVVT